MAQFGNKKRAHKGERNTKTGKAIKCHRHRRVSGGLAILFYLLAIVLAAITFSSCAYSNGFTESLYVAEIRRNASQGMPSLHLSVGYLGGCITVTDDALSLGQASNAHGIEAETRCTMNMYAHDEDDLREELSKELKNPSSDYISNFLNDTLHQARHLQMDVFHYTVPLVQLVLFTLGGAMFFTASTNIASKKSYRYLLVLSFLFIVFAMGLMFATAFGSLQALHGLVNGEGSQLPSWAINNNDSIHFADRLYFIQVAQAVMVICFAIFMGLMFAGGVKPKRKGAV